MQPEPDGEGGVQWRLMRNCSLAPRQVAAVYASLVAVSMAIAGFFFVAGAPYVAIFAGAELLVVGAAFLVFARHAGDGEILQLRDGRLVVEQRCGAALQRTEFQAGGVRVEPSSAPGALVVLTGLGARAEVGRHLQPHRRGELARALRRALHEASCSRRGALTFPESESNHA